MDVLENAALSMTACLHVAPVVVVVVVGVGVGVGVGVVVVVAVGLAVSKSPRQRIKNHPRQGNHQWRTPWWRRSQRDQEQSLEGVRGSGEPSSRSKISPVGPK